MRGGSRERGEMNMMDKGILDFILKFNYLIAEIEKKSCEWQKSTVKINQPENKCLAATSRWFFTLAGYTHNQSFFCQVTCFHNHKTTTWQSSFKMRIRQRNVFFLKSTIRFLFNLLYNFGTHSQDDRKRDKLKTFRRKKCIYCIYCVSDHFKCPNISNHPPFYPSKNILVTYSALCYTFS